MTNLFINFVPNALDAFKSEAQAWHDFIGLRKIETVYISCAQGFDSGQIVDCLNDLEDFFGFVEWVEITVECDQNEVTRADLKTLHCHGVTRVSFSDLKLHPKMDEFNLFNGVNFDADGTQEKNVNRVVKMGQGHVSLYGVETFEQFEKYRIDLEKRWLFPYDRHHFCGDGFECRYLINVLSYKDYIGLGPGAHSRVMLENRKHLFVNESDIAKWKKVSRQIKTGRLLSDRDVLEEFLLQNLSLYKGMDLNHFSQFFGGTIFDVFAAQTIEGWLKTAQIDLSNKKMRLCGKTFFTPELIIKEIVI